MNPDVERCRSYRPDGLVVEEPLTEALLLVIGGFILSATVAAVVLVQGYRLARWLLKDFT